MKKTTTVCLLFITLLAFAGKGGDDFSKHDKIFYKSGSVELGDATISIENAVATDAFIKFKMVVKNNTAEYLLVKPGEIVLLIDGKEYKATEKDMIIDPNDIASKVVDIKGLQFRVQQVVIKFNGFTKVEVSKTPVVAPNFKLPVSQNTFEAGAFTLNQLSNEKQTDVVSVKFNVTYNSSNIGIVSPTLAALKFPNGSEFANMKTRSKSILLEKGKTDDFRLTWHDMPKSNGDAQFANLEILWRETFKEGKLIPITPQSYTMEWDPGLTKGKR